jgi:hypothetical protein
MTTQHHASFAKAISSSTQRLFRSNKNLLASNHIDAHTMRDIGFNPVGLN